METIQCRNCQKDRRVSSVATSLKMCLRCVLVTNKPMLYKCYKSITSQFDMSEFDKDMEEWYPTQIRGQ